MSAVLTESALVADGDPGAQGVFPGFPLCILGLLYAVFWRDDFAFTKKIVLFTRAKGTRICDTCLRRSRG